MGKAPRNQTIKLPRSPLPYPHKGFRGLRASADRPDLACSRPLYLLLRPISASATTNRTTSRGGAWGAGPGEGEPEEREVRLKVVSTLLRRGEVKAQAGSHREPALLSWKQKEAEAG